MTCMPTGSPSVSFRIRGLALGRRAAAPHRRTRPAPRGGQQAGRPLPGSPESAPSGEHAACGRRTWLQGTSRAAARSSQSGACGTNRFVQWRGHAVGTLRCHPASPYQPWTLRASAAGVGPDAGAARDLDLRYPAGSRALVRPGPRTAAAFGLLAVHDSGDKVQRLLGGRAWQRMHLWGTTQGLGMQPLNQLPERADRERQLGIEPRFGNALKALLEDEGWQVLMPFRL